MSKMVTYHSITARCQPVLSCTGYFAGTAEHACSVTVQQAGGSHPICDAILALPAGRGPPLFNTNNVVAPHYWPDTTAGATAAAHALRHLAEASTAARVTTQRQADQQAAGEALVREQQRRALAVAAAQADKQVRKV